MRRQLGNILRIFILLLPAVGFAQQYPQYSGYMFNPFAINPAYAGNYTSFQSTALIRNQWVNLDGAPKTAQFAIHGALKNEHTAVGLNVLSDQIGFSKTNTIMGTYAYRLLLPNSILSFGLRFGMANSTYNWNDIDAKDKVDPVIGSGSANSFHPLADAGLYYHTNTFYIGLSEANLFNVSGDLSKYSQLLKRHVFLASGKSFTLSDKLVLNPSILIKMVDGAVSIDVNCNLLIKEKLWLGISTRLSYGYVFLFQYVISEKMKIGYAYDYGINEIGVAGGASHEVMLGYNFNVFNKKMQSFRYL